MKKQDVSRQGEMQTEIPAERCADEVLRSAMLTGGRLYLKEHALAGW